MRKVITIVISLLVGFVGAYTNDFVGANLRDLNTFIEFAMTSVIYTIIAGLGGWWLCKSNDEMMKD